MAENCICGLLSAVDVYSRGRIGWTLRSEMMGGCSSTRSSWLSAGNLHHLDRPAKLSTTGGVPE
jgi:hypothetical protein